MKCSPKTMLKIGLGLVALLGIAFVAFPQFKPFIIGIAPLAIFAICPLAMIFCMKGMNKDKGNPNGCTSCEHRDQTKVVKPKPNKNYYE